MNYNYYYNSNNDKNNTLNYFSKFDNKNNGNYFMEYNEYNNQEVQNNFQPKDFYYNNYYNSNYGNGNHNFAKRKYDTNGIGRGKKEYFQDGNNFHNNNNYNNYNYNNKNFNGKGNNFYNKNMQQKKKTFTYNMRWDGYDPFTVKTLIFRAETYMMNRYPNLGMINSKNEGFSERISDKSKYFVIKSFNEEDVHKAIKYSL